MKGKKDGIIWSIRLIVFSAIIFFVLQFHLYTDDFRNMMKCILPFELSEWRDFFMVITSGIFTSSFVTLIMNCTDYKNEKIDALENYYIVSSEFLCNFQNIEYLYIREDITLVRNYYLERASNDLRKRSGTDEKLNYKAKVKLQEWIWEHEDKETRRIFRKVKQKYLAERLEDTISKYDKQLESIAKQYIKLSEISYQNIENAYAKIDFLFTNKLNRNGFIYKFLHERQRNLKNKIQFESYYFKQYDTQPKIVILDKILKLQNEIFKLEDGKDWKRVYNQYYYEITCNLEFLSQLIYKGKYEENYPQRNTYIKMAFIDTRK